MAVTTNFAVFWFVTSGSVAEVTKDFAVCQTMWCQTLGDSNIV